MFERFTEQSRRVVVLAQEEARLLQHHYIGAEHLLLGLIHEGRGTAARVLAAADVALDSARDQVEAATGRGVEPPSGHIPFTPAAKKALELSLAEAIALENYHVATGHVLLGLIRSGDNPALAVLAALGADPEGLAAAVTRELREHPEPGEAGSPGGAPRAVTIPRIGPAQEQVGLLLRDTLPGLLTVIEERLSAIEQRLGIGHDEAGPTGSDQPDEPAAGG